MNLFFMAVGAHSADRRYELHVKEQAVNKSGYVLQSALTMSLSDDDQGSIPAPTLKFRLGDRAVIKVVNHTSEIISMHWHGILLPAGMDGPMFFNNKPIEPGESFTFRFPIKHKGTYWYHSHTELQEQRGLYGAIVIHDPAEKLKVDEERVVVLSDWSSESPAEILRNIKADGHYYEFKKNSRSSWLGAIRHGAVWDYVKAQWTRMGAMDLSDVGYDAFLINGEEETTVHRYYHPGTKVKFRIINAGASSFFYVNIGKLRDFEVVAKDGVDVKAVTVNELLMGMGETYDIVFTVPQHGAYELRATAQDITGFASLNLGHGPVEQVPDKLRPNPYVMDHGSHSGDGAHGGHGGGDEHNEHGDGDSDKNHGGGGEHNEHGEHRDGGSGKNEQHDHGHEQPGAHATHNMAKQNKHRKHRDGGSMGSEESAEHSHAGHNMSAVEDSAEQRREAVLQMPMSKRLNYSMLEALEPTAFPHKLPRYSITLTLDGDMERYNWHINGKAFSEETFIEVNAGDVVRFTMVNRTMMHHPMHLHGHFFRLLNGAGDHAPLAHTVDVGPMQTQTIEFHADNPGLWFFHCHNLYHMKMGMARIIKYRGTEQSPELMASAKKHKHKFTHDNSAFTSLKLGLFTNHADLMAKVNKGRYEIKLKLELDDYDKDTFEADLLFKRYLTKYFSLMAGVEYEDEELEGLLGLSYMLPLQIKTHIYATSGKKVVVELEKHIPISSRLELVPEAKYEYSTEDEEESFWELESTLLYKLTSQWDVGVFYKYKQAYEDLDKDDHSVGFGMRNSF